MIASLRARLRPEEALLLVYGLGLLALCLWAHMPYLTRTYHIPFLVVIAIVAALRAAREREHRVRAAVGAVRDFLPFFALIVVYETLHDLTPILRPRTVDGGLAALDRFLFGRDLAVWMTSFASPWLTRIMVFCYASYFFAPALLGGIIYLYGPRATFRRCMLSVSVASMLGFLIYLLVPAVGPYIYQAAQFPGRLPAATPGTHYVVEAIDAVKGAARDCFPSMHTAHSTLVLLGARAFRRVLFWLYLPVAVGLYVATVYLRMHYAIDVLAGFALAGGAWWLAPQLELAWSGTAD
ncbi:MAG TPA: phosphatase PAP2 family protein [Polyangia bacterium]|nr:phosphatase PAP2 family protein [Polyangia bacterium]